MCDGFEDWYEHQTTYTEEENSLTLRAVEIEYLVIGLHFDIGCGQFAF